jgi:hypothetical protein
VEVHTVARRRGSHIFYKIGSGMMVRLSALRASRPTPSPKEESWYYRVEPRAIVRLEGIGKLKNPITSSGNEPATFRLVAQFFNQLRCRAPMENGRCLKSAVGETAIGEVCKLQYTTSTSKSPKENVSKHTHNCRICHYLGNYI